MHICANGVRQAGSEANARIEHESRYWRACYRSRLQRRRGASRPPACGFGHAGRQPPSHGNRRVRRPRHRDRQSRYRRAGARLHRAAHFHRRARWSRPAICCFASSRTPTKRRSSSRTPISPRPRRLRSMPRCNWSAPRNWCTTRTYRNRRSIRAPPTKQSAQADILQAQAALEQAKINLGYTEIHCADRRPHRPRQLHRRQSGQPVVRDARDHRQPGPDLCHLSRRASAISSNIKRGSQRRRQRTACDRAHQAARRQHLCASGLTEFPRHPGSGRHRHRRGARATPESATAMLVPGGIVGVIVERGKPRSALVIPQSAVQIDQAGRYVLVVDDAKKVELRRVTTGPEQGTDIDVDRRAEGGRARHRRGHSESAPRPGRGGKRRAAKPKTERQAMFSTIFIDRPRLRLRHRHRHHARGRSSPSRRSRSRNFPTSCRRRSR